MKKRTRSNRAACGAILLATGFAPFACAQAAVAISSAQTQNMSCTGGVCAPTGVDAVLNVSDLENLLATGNVEVTTTGAGVQANDLELDAPLSWSDTSTLALDAYRSITVKQTLSVDGEGGLTLTMNAGGAGGALSFGPKGHAVFQSLDSPLTIDGTPYVLVNSVKSLASAVAANPGGTFALANDYDAAVDGTYRAAPVQGGFTGSFDGLGNAISHLTINGSGYIGLFQVADATIENLDLRDIKLTVKDESIAGGLGGLVGTTSRVRITGTIRGRGPTGNSIGGLAGGGGPVIDCSANVRIIEYQSSLIGGLISVNGGINMSFATGSMVGTGSGSLVGGLTATNSDSIENSYATGSVTGGARSKVGGLVGKNRGGAYPGVINASYSTGAVHGGNRSKVGGFAGVAYGSRSGYIQQSYWDTTTSGTNEGTGRGNKEGITGLTTEQLQSGLPAGFDPKVWAENPKINNGLPYLIDNPPR